MRLRYQVKNHISGMISIETAIGSIALIMVFSLFMSIAGYGRAYLAVNEYIFEKTEDVSIAGYGSGIDLCGIVDSREFVNIRNGHVSNLFITYSTHGDEISMDASYTYEGLIKSFRVSTGSVFTAWSGSRQATAESVWDLPPAQRGREIERIFGGGLPEFFPVLDAFEPVRGHGVSIVSINTTLQRYENGTMISDVISEKAEGLSRFKGGECDGFTVSGMDIDSKELLVVIPENILNREQEDAIRRMHVMTRGMGIELTVRCFQYAKKEESASSDTPWADIE